VCGIVGTHARGGDVVAGLVEGLRVLEYRGYDSAGVAAVVDGAVEVRKRAGRIENLDAALAEQPLSGSVGIGHTRWATHGPPTDANAHPHTDGSGRMALVHNGIIENWLELRKELEADGTEFLSDTDTEVLTRLVGRELEKAGDLAVAVRAAIARVEGAYAIAVTALTEKGTQLVCARHGPPLIVASTADAGYVASDQLALLPFSRDMVFLQDGDVAEVGPGSVVVTRPDGAPVERAPKYVAWDAESAEKGGYPHYMLKEIHEQPDVLARTAFDRIDEERGDVVLDGDGWDDETLRGLERLQIVGCGTALHAGYIIRYLVEGLAGLPVDIDYASEFRYRGPRLVPGTAVLAISQSGETADTLAAMRIAADLGARKLSICNVLGSTVVRESDAYVLTHAGPEVGVASTKAFIAQLVAGVLLAVRLGRARGALSEADARHLLDELRLLRPKLELLLDESVEAQIRALAERHQHAKGFLFLGRGVNYPIALEGALKLKEISYMHAEGYPAGEMKHGPIALIEPGMTVVVVNSAGRVAEKVRSNIEQVKARGGEVVAFGSDPATIEISDGGIALPDCDEWLSPILNVVPLQMLSYHIAALRGCDIDKPRNLAKSVTVE
jgi:glucosamine--fructose-6-phosphate aminotransferase (isomerizing)